MRAHVFWERNLSCITIHIVDLLFINMDMGELSSGNSGPSSVYHGLPPNPCTSEKENWKCGKKSWPKAMEICESVKGILGPASKNVYFSIGYPLSLSLSAFGGPFPKLFLNLFRLELISLQYQISLDTANKLPRRSLDTHCRWLRHIFWGKKW